MYHSRTTRSILAFLPKTARDHLRYVSIILLLVVALVIFMMQRAGNPWIEHSKRSLMDGSASILSVISYPVRLVTSLQDHFREYVFVLDENRELRKLNRKLEQQVSILLEQAAENQRLHRLIHLAEQSHRVVTAAKILTDVSGPFSHSLLVSAGATHGVQKGMAVVSDDGLVGRVIEVGEVSSRVLLITDINARTPVISELSRERSIAAGTNSEYPELNYLSKDSQLQVGEKVVTSGEGSLFPAGLDVGKIMVSEDGSYHVIPSVAWHRLEVVAILAPEIIEKTLDSKK